MLVVTVLQAVDAQILKPAKLNAEPISREVKTGDVIDLVFNAQIDRNWYMYTTGFDPECGPILAEITLEPVGFELVGVLKAVNDKGKHDPIFDCPVRYFEGTGQFVQQIRVLNEGPLEIKGVYEGQTCSNITGQCVALEGDLFFPVITVGAGSQRVDTKKNDQPRKAEPAKEKETQKLDTARKVQAVDTATTRNFCLSPPLSKELSEWWPYRLLELFWRYQAFVFPFLLLVRLCEVGHFFWYQPFGYRHLL